MSSVRFGPVAAATGKTVELAMQRLWLTGRVLPAGARLTVQHVFRSEEQKPLEVIYAFPLPRDAALRRFRIIAGDLEAHSELMETEAAAKTYEQGIAQGALSALARQHGDGIVNLTVGNIRPQETVTVYLEILAGVELRDDGFRFRFPFTLAPAYHARAKAAVVAPGEGEMELPADEFGDVFLPRWVQGGPLHQVGFDLAVTSQLELDELGSPSHAVRVRRENGQRSTVALAAEKDVPNRDLVLDAHYREAAPQILAGRIADGTGRFAAIVPSSSFGVNPEAPRRVVILLDRSGSMKGAPLTQAMRSIEACLGALSDNDLFGLVAFDHALETFEPKLLPGSRENRNRAHEFLGKLSARGGTELANGFLAANKLLENGGGDVFILTDGQVSGTEQILAHARSTKTRLHCLGIGSASQDRFLAVLARETGGVSRFVTPQERVDMSAVDLFAAIGRPVASGLKVAGDIQPEPASLVFSGTPVLLFGQGTGNQIELTWDGGQMTLPITSLDDDLGETVWLLQGSRLITDWESRYPSEEALAPLEKRKQSRVAARLRELSQTYGLASRETSLVAVMKRAGDRPGELPETRVVPVGMPRDTNFGAYFGSQTLESRRMVGTPLYSAGKSVINASLASLEDSGVCYSRISADAYVPATQSPDELLFDLAASIEPDGGLPGSDTEDRAGATMLALLTFLSQGHSAKSGAFRSHVARLAAFLKSVKGLPANRQRVVDAVLELVREGRAPAGDWLAFADTDNKRWKRIEEALASATA